MKEQNHNINDLFAAARNAEVNISLEDIRANLSQNSPTIAPKKWHWISLSIIGILSLSLILMFILSKETGVELSIKEQLPPLNNVPVAEAIEISSNHKKENQTLKPPYNDSKHNKKTLPKPHEPKSDNTSQKDLKLPLIQPIVFKGALNVSEPKPLPKLEISVQVEQQPLPKKNIPVVEMPNLNINTLQDDPLEGGKGEIHYMETLKNKETISLKSYIKKGKKHLKLDRYNAAFECIQSIDLSQIIQKNKRALQAVKYVNNQLLLITSETLLKEKAKLYLGHQIDYNNMQKTGSVFLGKFSSSKEKRGINIQTSSNGKYLLVNLKPASIKHQKRAFEKGVHETISFQVYDQQMQPLYSIKKRGLLDYGTAIDNTGKVYIWKAQPSFFLTNRLVPTLKNGPVLYQHDANSMDSLVLKEDSFLKTISLRKQHSTKKEALPIRPSADSMIAYNHRLIETKGLALTLSPQGNPILYGYLKNMRGLQQLTFTADSLAPYHYSVLDFQTKEALEAEEARKNGLPKLTLKVDEVFFDEAANFYVLSSSYSRSYLPLVAREKSFQDNNFSEKIPVPNYPSMDIYVHKFNKAGEPIMNAKIANNAMGQPEKPNNYSYLFNKEHFSVVYLDHIVQKDSFSHSNINHQPKNKNELTIATAQQNGEIIRFTASGSYAIDIEDYRPVKYFRNKGETLALLKAGNSYKISKLSYKNSPKKVNKN